jgi:hypothetical protein
MFIRSCHIIALCLSVLMLACALSAGSANARDYAEWRFCRPLDIDNSGHPHTLYDHPVRVVLTGDDFDFAEARPDGADLRFAGSDRATELHHWIEFWSVAAESAVVWVEVPVLPAAAVEILYLYHGHDNAPSVSDGDATFLFFDDFEDFSVGGLNAPSPLVTPTYEGSGQVVHPDVVRVPGGWMGYEYWMAMTPYPNGNDDYENPSVIVSQDGIGWIEPPGIVNPLAPEPPGHNDDPDMLLVDGVMRIYYNETNSDGTTYMSLLTSTNGVDWTGPDTVFTRSNYVMSPTLLYEDGLFYMWYVHSPGGCSAAQQDFYLRTSVDGVTWGPEQPVAIPHPGRVPWHFDIVKVGAKYIMLYIAYPDGSSCGNTSLYYAESDDRLNWTVETEPLLVASATGWDAAQIYRVSFLTEGDLLRIWYSARSTGGQWRVGYVEGEKGDFQAANVNHWDEVNGQAVASTDHVRSGQYGLREDGGSPFPQVFADVNGPVCFTAWLYDDLGVESGRLNILRVWDGGTATYPLHAIGVGVYTGQSTTHYAYHTEGWNYTTTTLPRSEGWHKLSIRVRDVACDLLVDDVVVGELGVLDELDITRVSLEGFTGGPGWFDDAYVRPYAHPEPSASVGAAIPVSAPAPFAATVLEPNRPNPLNPGTDLAFRLPAAGPVSLRIADVRGRVMRTLLDETLDAGRHVVFWDGRDEAGRRVSSGAYVYRLVTTEGVVSRKLVVVK